MMKWTHKGIALATLLLAGCPEPSREFPPTDLPDNLRECTVADDCVIVELGCCDACNGGFRAAFNTEISADTIDDYREDCSSPVACTEMACEPAIPACINDLCFVE